MSLQSLPAPLVDTAVVAIFAVVYLGMFLGGLPRLKLDRSGVALLGAIAVMAVTGMGVDAAARAVDLPTIVLLFAFMVVSAQMRLGGFYTEVTRRVGALPLAPAALLAALIAVAAALSAVFSNDVVCLAMTPVVLRIALQRGLPPVPLLVALACAANIGSAATLIGNPQNMLIGSVLQMPFGAYAAAALPPVLGALLWLWGVLAWALRRQVADAARRGVQADGAATSPRPAPGSVLANEACTRREIPAATVGAQISEIPRPAQAPLFDAWQSAKGLTVAMLLMALFLFTEVPREVTALVGAAVLLLSRRLHSAQVMGFVDWPLLLLFIGLFIVNHAFESTGLAAQAVAALAAQGVRLSDPGVLLVAGVALSNLVSNVPAVMLLLPHLQGFEAGLTLALVSTFAGNLLLVGSIANLIVADLAAREGVIIGARRHAALGVPVTLGSLVLLWGWMRV
jgi:Na+/H+ antiporter NhaD/arsenite permease-like protein